MNKKTLRQDNAGMSLLELVVAVSIFMVLALLLFRGFVSSSRLNKKSGIYLSATTTAQNIMEEIKAKTFAQTALAFNYPINPVTKENRFSFLQDAADISAPGDSGDAEENDNTDGSTSSVVTKEMIKSGDKYQKTKLYEEVGNDADKVTSSILSTDKGKTYTFLPRTKGSNASKYYFSMRAFREGTSMPIKMTKILKTMIISTKVKPLSAIFLPENVLSEIFLSTSIVSVHLLFNVFSALVFFENIF